MKCINFIINLILYIDAHLAELVAQYGVWVYNFLVLILFCETGLVVTPFLPGTSLRFVAGAQLALPSNGFDIHVMVLFLMALAMSAGDAANYTIGRITGEKLCSRPDSKLFRRSYLEKLSSFYARHGNKTIILARLRLSCGFLHRSWPTWDTCATATRYVIAPMACCGFSCSAMLAIFLAMCRWCSRIF